MVGPENMFPFRSELRWIPSFKVWGYFMRNAYVRASQLRTKFRPTSNELRANFVQTLAQL